MPILHTKWWQQTIAGVGLIITHQSPNGTSVLTIKENEDKPKLKKKSGDRSFPMETCEIEESVQDSLTRLVTEELSGMDALHIDEEPAGLFEIMPSIWLLVWWATSEDLALPTLPLQADVSDPKWESIDSLVSQYPNLRHGALKPLQARKRNHRLVRETY